MTIKLKVPATARLVLDAAAKIYDSPSERLYISKIDTEEVSDLLQCLLAAYPLFREMVFYRKQSVRDLLQKRMQQYPLQQVLILGAGLDPLSLLIIEKYKDRISNIFEIDNGYIEEKEKIYENILQGDTTVQFIRCDVTDTSQLDAQLRQYDFRADLPTLIIFEGLIYYITNEEFINTMQLFSSVDHRNMLLLDFMLTRDDIPAYHLHYYNDIIKVIEKVLNIKLNITSRLTITEMAAALNASQVEFISLYETARRLLGENHVFRERGDGFLEMAVFSL